MRHLLNTLFVTTEDSYLSLDGENIVVLRDDEVLGRFPLHGFETILYFGYKGASPALMGACAKRDISICFLTPGGRFLCRVCGETRGNVLLRKTQVRVSDSEAESNKIARNFLIGKIYNQRWILERATRDHPLSVNTIRLKEVSGQLKESLKNIGACKDLDTLRGLEGEAASLYFSVLDDLILQNKETFFFSGRSRRPPTDCCNAMLSFCYTLLAHDCAAALESVGLDPYIGFLHRDRPGRISLALDLMEELRGCIADRFVIKLINSREIQPKHFMVKENESVLLTDSGRKIILSSWQERKKNIIKHPFLDEKIQWGLVPYIQALLLARFLRGDLDEYPPFMWK